MIWWTIAWNDLFLTLKDKMFFFWLLVFPLLFSLLFGLAFPGSSSRVQKATLNVLDKDQSFLSEALIRELGGEKYQLTLLEEEAEKRYRTLVIPEGFTKNILAGTKVELVLETETDASPEASQTVYSHVLKAAIKVLTKLVTIAPEDEEALRTEYDELQITRLITLRTEMAGKLRAIPAGFNHTVPAAAVMFLLFNVLMYGGINLLQERRQGLLERLYLSPATYASILGGKWLSRVSLGMVQIVLLFLAGKVLFKTYWGPSLPALLLVSLFFCGTIAGMSILLGSILRKEEVLIVLNILLANLMAALGGCWFPQELFPAGVKNVSYIFPTGWTMDAFHKLIFFGYDLNTVLPHILVLLGYTLVFFGLAVKFFKLRKA